ncbi:hypothetical protein [Noviherbaspirillum galbum]|uniref:Uncharacterized protein n=1 Tax=Noviherbaspirillum galbum TaxID=2709383 RepID=A0A6B3SVU4_9BURK|nr:hypothetical protein [Noviherbaspirillum galbum]NEX63026.1 hypothetical protein [Noviherbaspirillum galbum]
MNVVDGMQGYRQAAAALHGYAESDREWLLGAFPEHDRAILRDYLGELDALGFVPGQEARTARQPATPIQDSALEQIRRASADEIHASLAKEPCALIGDVLMLASWPWKAEFLERLSGARRNAVLRHASEKRNVAPSRQSFLLTLLAKTLQDRDAAYAGRHDFRRESSSVTFSLSLCWQRIRGCLPW